MNGGPDASAAAATDTRAGTGAAVVLEASVLDRYQRFSLYNSPYPAHDDGCAIDLYPGGSDPESDLAAAAPSPVGGVVRETRTVQAPPKPYAPDHDHLILIDVAEPAAAAGLVARVLHVDPTVEAGDRVAVGDDLGELVRAGFFAPWVGTHLHVGFREPGQHLYRATGSLPIVPDVDVRRLAWDGTGTVVATGETYAILDAPAHPNPGAEWVGIEADDGGVLDGGLPHYETGGVLGRGRAAREDGGGAPADAGDGEPVDAGARAAEGGDSARPIGLNGDRIGVADGRTVDWRESTVLVGGEPVTGLSLFCARDGGFGAKVICPDRSFAVGERLSVSVERA